MVSVNQNFQVTTPLIINHRKEKKPVGEPNKFITPKSQSPFTFLLHASFLGSTHAPTFVFFPFFYQCLYECSFFLSTMHCLYRAPQASKLVFAVVPPLQILSTCLGRLRRLGRIQALAVEPNNPCTSSSMLVH
jgi:hypothetical protein